METATVSADDNETPEWVEEAAEQEADALLHPWMKKQYQQYQDKWRQGLYVQALGHLDIAFRTGVQLHPEKYREMLEEGDTGA